MPDLVAVKLNGLADTFDVERFVGEVMEPDFDPADNNLPPINLLELRNSATLDPFAIAGRFAADTILSVHVQKSFMYSGRGVEKNRTATSLELVGKLEIPEFSIASRDTRIGIKHNKGKEAYYSIIAQCLFKR